MSTHTVLKPVIDPKTGATIHPSDEPDKPATIDLTGYDPTKLKVLLKLGVIKAQAAASDTGGTE